MRVLRPTYTTTIRERLISNERDFNVSIGIRRTFYTREFQVTTVCNRERGIEEVSEEGDTGRRFYRSATNFERLKSRKPSAVKLNTDILLKESSGSPWI